MKEKQIKKARKRSLKIIKYTYLGLFVLLIANIIYFVIFSSNNLAINTYNPRLKIIEDSIIRGKIFDRDGMVLAETITSDGKDYRVYPYENVFAHTVGYSDQGKTGIESLMNLNLLRSNMPVFTKLSYDMTNRKSLGDNVITTLDVDLQMKAYELLGDNRGAIVAMEPSTGKILAMVSKPDFDPNYIAYDWERLREDEVNSPLLNRATQGLYPPGSTFKIMTTMEYVMENPYNNFIYFCQGTDYFGHKKIHCFNDINHGREDLKTAFANSCNTAFAKIGEEIDIDGLNALSTQLLFNQPLPYELPYSTSSFTLSSQSSSAEIAETVIGQGKTMITPLHNALITATIANGGIMMTPYLIDRIENNEGTIVEKRLPIVYDILLDTEITRTLTEYMVEVVNTGTAKGSALEDYQVAGKTGSAENPFGDSHAWYVGFAPAQNPEIVLAIVVENVGNSGTNSVPMAKELFELYFYNK